MDGDSFFGLSDDLFKIEDATLVSFDPDGRGERVARIPDGVVTIGDEAFSGSAVSEIEIPASVAHVKAKAFLGADSLCEIMVDEENETLKSVNGNLYTKDGTKLVKCVKRGAKTLNVSSGVETICPYAFYGFTSLEKLTLSNGVSTVGDCAFYGCTSLSSLTLSDSVVAIGSKAFYGCPSLSSLKMSSGIKIIKEQAFCGCSELKSLTLPEGMKSVGYLAFCGCVILGPVVIPKSMEFIGFGAFYGTRSSVIFSSTRKWSFVTRDGVAHMIFPLTLDDQGEVFRFICGDRMFDLVHDVK